MSYCLIFIAVNLLIVLHEFGHLVGAKFAGIPVSRFSIGFGRRIWGVKIGETEYRLSVVPIGGYVLPALAKREQIDKLPVSRRIVFSMGGPLANLIGAVACISIAAMLRSGISSQTALWWPVTQTWQTIGELFTLIPATFHDPQELSGIVGIVAIGGQTVGTGLVSLLIFCFLMNVNLFVLNILPVPPLDGGRIFFALLQRLYAPLRLLRIPVALTGWVLLVGVLAYATAMDISRLLAQAP